MSKGNAKTIKDLGRALSIDERKFLAYWFNHYKCLTELEDPVKDPNLEAFIEKLRQSPPFTIYDYEKIQLALVKDIIELAFREIPTIRKAVDINELTILKSLYKIVISKLME